MVQQSAVEALTVDELYADFPFVLLVIGILLYPVIETIIDESLQKSRDLRRKKKKQSPAKP